MFVTTNPARDHAYLILNSASATELLLDGSVTVVVGVPIGSGIGTSGDKEEDRSDRQFDDITLWFEKADHLIPQINQDPFTLYVCSGRLLARVEEAERLCLTDEATCRAEMEKALLLVAGDLALYR